MGLTLVAVLTAALLLPGIIAVWAIYSTGKIAEVEPSLPALGSIEGISMVGAMSIVVHLAYSMILSVVAQIPPVIKLPLANPYLLFMDGTPQVAIPAHAFAMFAGFGLLCFLALGIGKLAGLAAMKYAKDEFFYGPLAEIIRKSRGSDDVIVAYVLLKLSADGRQIGYQGVVDNLIRDESRFPHKVILRDVSVFYLTFRPAGPEKREVGRAIKSIALSANDWHNIAFRVFRFIP